MAVIKPKRSSPTLDMTPMVDLAFLLVTFFMLTTSFRPEEVVSVDMPRSASEIPIPDINIMTITIANDGRCFFNLVGKNSRSPLLKNIGEAYDIKFTPNEAAVFENLADIGVPIRELKTYLNLDRNKRKDYVQKGIPTDSTETATNELLNWVYYSRGVNSNAFVTVKGDKDAPMDVVFGVVDMLRGKPKVKTFNLITNTRAVKRDE